MTDTSMSGATRPPPPLPTGRLREVMVHASMILVMVTLGVVCHRTMGIGQIPALGIALGAYWAMLLMHALVLRRQEMLALWGDLDGVIRENEQLRRLMMRPPPHPPLARASGPASGGMHLPPPAPPGSAARPATPGASPSLGALAPSGPAPRGQLLPVGMPPPAEPVTVPSGVRPMAPQPPADEGAARQLAAPAGTGADEAREREVALMQSLIKELADQIKGNGEGAPQREAGYEPAPSRPGSEGNAAATASPAPVNDYRRLAEVVTAVDAERIELCIEPILGLDDRKARHFEVSMLLRGDDGALLDPAELAEAMAGTGLIPRIETAKLVRALRLAGALSARGARPSLFSSVSEESLRDDAFRLSLAGAGASERTDAGTLVMSVAQSEVSGFGPAHWAAIEALGRRGLQFALVDVVDLDMDFELLKAKGFHFVRLDASVFLDGLPAPHGIVPASDICRHLATLGFSLIVSRIGDEMALAKVLGFGAMLGQGALFGGRRPVRLDI